MAKMTKTQIQERQNAIWTKMDEMEQKSREANGGEIKFTDEEAAQYDALVRESAGLSAKAKAMASDAELRNIRSAEEKGAKLREMLKNCVEKRENATTILANKVTTGDDQNVNANLEAGGLIPVTIKEIIDTKVPGIELPDSLVMVTGVTGTEIIPYSTNDVKFTVNKEVQKVGVQALDFTNITAAPVRVAASLAVSHRAIDNAAFDIYSFMVFKMQKGWAIFRAVHVYAHGNYAKLPSPFAEVTVEELTLDENIGKNLAKKIAEMYDLGFEGDPELIMDKVTEVELAFTKRIPNSAGDRTVVEGGKCVGYNYKVSPYVDYSIDANGAATKDVEGGKPVRYIAIGHFGYLAEEQHGEFRFNVDATSAEVFNSATVVISMTTDYSLTELSSKVNGNDSGKPQAFKLIKLVQPASSNEIGG
jgi:hypothetical protein